MRLLYVSMNKALVLQFVFFFHSIWFCFLRKSYSFNVIFDVESDYIYFIVLI